MKSGELLLSGISLISESYWKWNRGVHYLVPKSLFLGIDVSSGYCPALIIFCDCWG